MTQKELETWLRTPRGVLALLGGSLAAAVVLALLLGTQRGFFERHVREKLPPATVEANALGADIAAAETQARVRALGPKQREELYAAWMAQGAAWPMDAPALLVRADPFFLRRAERTLIAGSLEQRRAAVRFLAATADPRARVMLEEAARRAERRREVELAEEIRKAVVSLSGARSRVHAHGPDVMA